MDKIKVKRSSKIGNKSKNKINFNEFCDKNKWNH